MRALVLVLATLALVGASIPASAVECTPTTSTTDAEHVILEAPARNAAADYVAIDLCQPACLSSVWPYYELNGIAGLQRGDDAVDDTCGGMIDPDAWILF